MSDPQGLTIDQLRELLDVESHLFFAMDAPNETFKVPLLSVVEYARETINVTPTGSFIMWPGATVPKGYIELAGQHFSVGSFPILGAMFPNGRLPDTRGMTLKHASGGRNVLSFEAEAVKSHGHGASTTVHGSDLGRKYTNTAGRHNHPFQAARSTATEGVAGRGYAGNLQITLYTQDAGDHSHYIDMGAHAHAASTSVHAFGSPKNLVDNIAVKFIVKQE